MEHAGELHTYHTSTYDGKTLRQGIEVQKTGRVNHTRIGLDAIDR